MVLNKMTYIVNEKRGNLTQSYTLRDWCKMQGISYNTILARIWRTNPEGGGIIYIDSNDTLLRPTKDRLGMPPIGQEAPAKKRSIPKKPKANTLPSAPVKKNRLKSRKKAS